MTDPDPTPKPSPATPNLTVVAPPAAAAPVELDLETRVARRKDELVAKLAELQSNAEITAVEMRDRIKSQLSQLAHHVKEGVVDGWANINNATRTKLARWLDN